MGIFRHWDNLAERSTFRSDRPVYVYYKGGALGDNLMPAYIVETLNDHDIDAYLLPSPHSHLVSCKKAIAPCGNGFLFKARRQNRTGFDTTEKHTVYTDLLAEFARKAGMSEPFPAKRDHIPVIYDSVSDSPIVDLVLVSVTGNWTPYRLWPFFDELRIRLQREGVRYIDASLEALTDQRFLTVIDRCKLFVTLETGASHYASQVANGKCLVLQSGYCNFSYWAGNYRYTELANPVSCAPCWKRELCDRDHECMTGLSVDRVMAEILARI